VGVYQQADGLLRVTVSFHDRVRIRWFDPYQYGVTARFEVEFTDAPEPHPPLFLVYFRAPHHRHRLWARFCESGSSCGDITRLVRPNAKTIRIWMHPLYGLPAAGMYFRGVSSRSSTRIIDRTHWAIVT
jgi:hypothetical protein